MHVWAVCVLVFFGVAELYQWLEGVTLPMPVLVGAGTLLAIASNSLKLGGLASSPAKSSVPPPEPTIDITATVVSPADSSTIVPAAPSRYYPGPQLPNLTPQSAPSVSFTIAKPSSPASNSPAPNSPASEPNSLPSNE